MRRVCVFISGRGSNLAAALDALGDQIALVVTSSAQAAGILKARRAGVPVLILPKKIDWPFLSAELKRRRVSRILLLGFMRIVPAGFISDWPHQIVNIHPSLLPKYPGLESIKRAFDEQSDLGCTLHEVIPEVDAGGRLLQSLSVRAQRFAELGFAEAELRVHQDEQKLVRRLLSQYEC